MTSVRHILVPALAVASVPIASVVLAGDLPSPVARHFAADGTPDGSASLLLLTLLVGAITLLIVAGSLLAVRSAPDRTTARTMVTVAHGMGVGLAALHLAVLLAQRGLADWTETSFPLSAVVSALLIPAAVAAAVGWAVSRDMEVPEQDRTVPADDVRLEPGEAVVWAGRATAVWAPIAGALLALIVVIVYLSTGDTLAVALLLPVAVIAGLAGQARVTVGPAGLRIVGGVVPGWPRLAIPLDEVADVRVEQVEVLTYGGLGYRVKPGVRAIVTWPGEALAVERSDGSRIIVTIPGARTAAGVLLAHRAATGPSA